jgi:DNA repair and recombination protein RAD52
MTAFTPPVIEALEAPLDRKHVTTREQSGRTLSYVEGWFVIAEANRIFGFDAWHRETVTLLETSRDLLTIKGYGGKPDYDQWRVSYLARVRITVGTIIREGTGYGSGMAKPEALGDAIESAAKEAETDAMKRAFMTFGNPFGLALYDKKQANVAADVPKPISAAAMKRGLEEIEKDLLDCESIVAVNQCARAWASIMERDGWSEEYREFVKEKFAARRQAITAGSDPAPVTNGDAYRNAKDGKPTAVDNISVG